MYFMKDKYYPSSQSRGPVWERRMLYYKKLHHVPKVYMSPVVYEETVEYMVPRLMSHAICAQNESAQKFKEIEEYITGAARILFFSSFEAAKPNLSGILTSKGYSLNSPQMFHLKIKISLSRPEDAAMLKLMR